jgi:hypothetical protein
MVSLSDTVPVPELVRFLISEVATGLARNVGYNRPIDENTCFSRRPKIVPISYLNSCNHWQEWKFRTSKCRYVYWIFAQI